MFRLLLTLSIFIFSHTAFAQISNTAESETFLDRVHMNLFSNFHGPELTDIGSPYNPGQKGLVDQKHPSKMNFDSTLTTSYLLDSDYSVGVAVPFFAYPVMGEGFVLGDVGAQIADKHFFRTREMTVGANLIVQLPTSEYTQTTGMDVGLKTTPYVRYIFPNSRFTVGAWTEAKAYLGVNENKKSFKLWAQPYVSYQMAPKFSWNIGFEMEGGHYRGQDTFDFTMVQSDIVPGFTYMISPKIMINPYLQIFTTEKVAMDRTALGAIISASI